MIKISSCDSQGSVYIGDSVVYRPIAPAHAVNVMEVLKICSDDVEGIVETSACANEELPPEFNGPATSLTLKHKRVARISYPHEWCATMLQDAAVFHLDLSKKLLDKNLYLKDAHPWNILFDRGHPIFVDFTSIVKADGLFSEDYLLSNQKFRGVPDVRRLAMLINEIYIRMYQPYFINPLLFYACGVRCRVRLHIENTTLNAATTSIALHECLPRRSVGRLIFKKMFRFIKTRWVEGGIYSRLQKTSDIGRFYTEMRRYVKGFPIAVGESAYSAYYQKKGEDHILVYSDDWNAKQKSVHDALNSPDICSVLDVACNTGWFALMAEKLGKSVVAFDIDEGCIEVLYSQVRHSRLNILPLVMGFPQLTQDRYSIHDGNKVLINAKERLLSDSVIALGIIHHLVLGLGLSFDEVLDSLVALCRKQLIIEFVHPEDAMIQCEPEFFPAYFKNRALLFKYDMLALIARIEARGFDVRVHASYPETRKILVCNKQVEA